MEDNFRVKSFSLTHDHLKSFIELILGKREAYGIFQYEQRNGKERKIGLGELSKETLPPFLTDFYLHIWTAPKDKWRKNDFDFYISSYGYVSIEGDRQVVADKEKTCRGFIENHKNNNRYIHTLPFAAFIAILGVVVLFLCVASFVNFGSSFPMDWMPYFTELSALIVFISCSVLLWLVMFMLPFIYPYGSIGVRRHTTLNKILGVSGTAIGLAGTVLPLI